MPLTIRPASTSDAPAIGALARQFADYLRDLGDETDFKLTTESLLRDGFGPDPAFKGLVADADGQVIGYLLYHFGYDTDAAYRNLHVVDLYVDSGTRNQGIGRALMTAAAEVARQSDAREMIWSVYHTNHLALAFYGKLGAREIPDLTFMSIPVSTLQLAR